MNREEVIARLRALQPRLNAEGIARLYLFGSVLHGEAGPDSDVDLFFESDNPRFNALDYVHVRDFANEILPWNVDLIERSCLHRGIREQVESEALRIF
jgi:predicted nucleotidyltransferase